MEQHNALIEKGINIIYTQMPHIEIAEESNLQNILGISRVNGILKQKGMRFTDEIFFGGVLDLEKLEYELVDVELEPTCKVYAYGLKGADGESIKQNSDLPPIVWRNTVGKSKIFVVNGKFFEENKGYGILSAIISQIYGDYIYPVVNASVMIYDSIPYEGETNEELLKTLYSRDSLQFQTDILMPNIVSICRRLDVIPTFYTTADAALPEMDYFERSVLGLKGELIYLEEDAIKAVDISRPDGRIWDQYPNLPVVITGFQKNDDDMVRLYSMGTTFGIVTHRVDVSQIVNPRSEEFDWVTVSKDYSEYIAYYQEDFGAFEQMTVRDAAIRYMEYRLMDTDITYNENSINVVVENMAEKASFVLHTLKDIERVTDCTYREIGKNAYLIETEKEEFSIFLSDKNAYYKGDF